MALFKALENKPALFILLYYGENTFFYQWIAIFTMKSGDISGEIWSYAKMVVELKGVEENKL